MKLLLIYNENDLRKDKVERVLEKGIIVKEKTKYLIK